MTIPPLLAIAGGKKARWRRCSDDLRPHETVQLLSHPVKRLFLWHCQPPRFVHRAVGVAEPIQPGDRLRIHAGDESGDYGGGAD